MLESWAFYAAAVPAVILMGLSKGGFSGMGVLATPLLSLVMSPVKAAAITLPILVVQDWVGVWAFRRDFDWRNLAILTPAAAVGVFIGWLMASRVSESTVRLAVGSISVGFVLFMAVRDRVLSGVASRSGVAPGVFWGALSGFTSFVSHAGGPPFLVYVVPQKLAPKAFAGTSTLFFAAVNLMKVPPYLALGQFSAENLTGSAAMVPLAVVATFAGVWVVRRLNPERFYGIVYALTFLVGVKLIYDGIMDN